MDNVIPIEFRLQEVEIKDAQLFFLFESSRSFEDINVLVVNRRTKEEIQLPSEKCDEQKALYRVSVSLDSLPVLDENIVDFYVLYQMNEESLLKKKIKSECKPIEFRWKWDEKKRVFFIPYTTQKGYFSIRISQKKLVSKTIDVDLSEEGILLLKGFAFLLDGEKGLFIKSKRLILAEINGLDSEERTFDYPLENKGNKDLFLYTSDKTAGFMAQIDVKKLYEENRMPALLQFHIEFFGEDLETGEEIVIRSSALKLKKNSKQSSIVETKKGPARFYIYPQKKKRNMRLRMNDYTLKTRTVYFIKGKKKKIISSLRKKKQKVTKKVSNKLKRLYYIAFGLVGKLPVKKKTVIFESFAGKQYSCNPRAIYEYMKEHNKDYKLYWSVNPEYTDIFEEKGIPYIKRFTLKWLFAMARAEYWVVNSRLPLWIPKPGHTTYLQTWHGTPLKRLAVDMEEVHMPGTNTEKYKRNFTEEAAKWDYLISPNAYSTEIFARAFQFNKTMIESGYPRNDFLHTDNNFETVQALKEKMELPDDKKVIIYAPTWRDDQFYKKGKYKFDLDLDLKKLKDEIGDEYVIILRMHYLVAENFDLEPYKGFAFDFSSYEDIRELYMVSDLLITDYSSVFFDFANLRRPMVFFVPDIETYRDKLRGFYFDFERDAPGPLVKTTDEVIDKIRETQASDYCLPDIFEPFYKKFCYLEEGRSAEKVVETVFE